MTHNRSKYVEIAKYVILFIFGITIGSFVKNIPLFTWKTEVSVAEVSNLLLTFFIAILVPFYLERNLNSKRIEKDLIIQFAEDTCEEIRSIHLLISEFYTTQKKLNSTEKRKVHSSCKKLSNSIFAIINPCKDYENSDEIKNQIERLKTSNQKYRFNITKEIHLTNFKKSTDLYRKLDETLITLKNDLNKIKLCINNY